MYGQRQVRYANNGCGCIAAAILVIGVLIVMAFAGLVGLVASAFAASPLAMLVLFGVGGFGVWWWWRRNVRVMQWGRTWQAGRAWQAGPSRQPHVDAGWEQPRPPVAALEEKSPYDILGITSGASQEEITVAYRQMAKQYHPDRVAHLGPEFQELAEVRMKEINQAYQELKEG